ncbi:unnamed protein product, partial [Mesorhabditis spiculigera]
MRSHRLAPLFVLLSIFNSATVMSRQQTPYRLPEEQQAEDTLRLAYHLALNSETSASNELLKKYTPGPGEQPPDDVPVAFYVTCADVAGEAAAYFNYDLDDLYKKRVSVEQLDVEYLEIKTVFNKACQSSRNWAPPHVVLPRPATLPVYACLAVVDPIAASTSTTMDVETPPKRLRREEKALTVRFRPRTGSEFTLKIMPTIKISALKRQLLATGRFPGVSARRIRLYYFPMHIDDCRTFEEAHYDETPGKPPHRPCLQG